LIDADMPPPLYYVLLPYAAVFITLIDACCAFFRLFYDAAASPAIIFSYFTTAPRAMMPIFR